MTEPTASELTRELLKKAGGLPEPQMVEGRVVNWPAEVVDLVDRTAHAIGSSEDPRELQKSEALADRAKRRILPWRRVPKSLIVAICRGIADNTHRNQEQEPK